MTRRPETNARRYGQVFDEMAADYDRYRPTYPDELIRQACQIAGIGSGDPVLEVGCGSGQLTRGLLARGLHVTALEPGQSLMALARQNLEGAGAVEFANARFEDALLPREQFPAVFSASAFHWVDPAVSWQKAADVLVPGGTLALRQYCGLEEPRTEGDQEATLAAIRKVAPDIAADWPAYRLTEHTADELDAVVRTMSFYARLAPDQRQALAREHAAIYERLGRPIRASTVAALVTARRA